MDATTKTLAGYVTALGYADFEARVRGEAKKRLIDTLGCAIGGYPSEPARIARSLAAATNGVPPARVLGSGQLTSMEMAAFANAVMVRFLDCNDTYIARGSGHPSDMLPALMAVADAQHATGRDFLVAMVAAYEVYGALADQVGLRDKGWDQGVFAVLGAAAGAGKLLRLSEPQMGDALAIAVSANVATRQTRAGELSMWKGCATAASARAGLFAALLALEGMTGPTAAFEGRHGVWEQVTGPFRLAPLGGGGRPFAIERSNLKFFPAEYHSQAPIWLALELRHKLAGAKIAAIDVQTYHTAWSEIGSEPDKWQPKTRETADHSLPYLLAAALTDGAISVETFSERRINDPALRELMGRIKIAENPEFTRRFPGEMVTEIALTTAAGERHVERASYPKGHVRNPMTDADIESKFCELSNGLLRPDLARRVLGVFRDLENVEDFGAALDTIRVG